MNNLNATIAEYITNNDKLMRLNAFLFDGELLSCFPEIVLRHTECEELDLSNHNISEIPIGISELQNLKVLDLSNNSIVALPNQLEHLKELHELKLQNNHILVLPDNFGQFPQLYSLDLSYNKLEHLPKLFGNMRCLKILDLKNNRLDSLSTNIGNLEQLEELDLSSNQISYLPNELSKLSSIRRLNLSNNNLIKLPSFIYTLENLEFLDISKNSIAELSPDILRLRNLKDLVIDTSEIENPPPEIASDGLEAIRNFFKQLLNEGSTRFNEVKLIVVGEAGAGKTSLVKKLQNPNYVLSSKEISTQGVDIYCWKINDKDNNTLNVNAWDFGGQEIYHSTHQFFLTKRSVYALVEDCRRGDTNLYYWLNIIELLGSRSPVVIVKNEKFDRSLELNLNPLQARFKNLVSAIACNLDTNRGLKEVGSTLNELLFNVPHIGTFIPASWHAVRTSIEKDHRDYVSFHEFSNICIFYGILEQKNQLQLIDFLHDLGICLCFREDPLLNQIVILKPEWATEGAYCLLDDSIVIRNYGRFTNCDILRIWSDEKYAERTSELLHLLQAFNLCYKLPYVEGTYIAPQLLHDDQPKYDWNYPEEIIIMYRYRFMPKGILSRFIVAVHQLIANQDIVWRSGVVIAKENAVGEIIQDNETKEITIRVAGKNRRDLFSIIQYELEMVHHLFTDLKYKKLIPCTCTKCSEDESDKVFYDYEVLTNFLAHDQNTIQCTNSFELLSVSSILNRLTSSQSSTNQSPISQAQETGKHEIFISYAWGNELEGNLDSREKLVTLISERLQAPGIIVQRDKTVLTYKDSIREFMQRLGKSKCIVLFVSDKYLKSEYCMFEVCQILKADDFEERVFPIVLKDADIFRFEGQLQYLNYWTNRVEILKKEMQYVLETEPTHATRLLNRLSDNEEIARRMIEFIDRIVALKLVKETGDTVEDFGGFVLKVHEAIGKKNVHDKD